MYLALLFWNPIISIAGIYPRRVTAHPTISPDLDPTISPDLDKSKHY